MNESGEIIRKCWLKIPQYFPHVVIDEYIIMPNHIHGIIFIMENVGAQNFVPLQMKQNKFQNIIPHSIGSILHGFKIGATKWFRQNTDKKTNWQRNYHEHVIQNED